MHDSNYFYLQNVTTRISIYFITSAYIKQYNCAMSQQRNTTPPLPNTTALSTESENFETTETSNLNQINYTNMI